eukprot:6599642-Pyramimonas_sp.AAC.1
MPPLRAGTAYLLETCGRPLPAPLILGIKRQDVRYELGEVRHALLAPVHRLLESWIDLGMHLCSSACKPVGHNVRI